MRGGGGMGGGGTGGGGGSPGMPPPSMPPSMPLPPMPAAWPCAAAAHAVEARAAAHAAGGHATAARMPQPPPPHVIKLPEAVWTAFTLVRTHTHKHTQINPLSTDGCFDAMLHMVEVYTQYRAW